MNKTSATNGEHHQNGEYQNGTTNGSSDTTNHFEERLHEKVFNDAIHGAISLHPLCVKVIDTHQFQRLRFLKQLGVSYFVFSSASHNRYEHSLGVCHLAGVWIKTIKDRQPHLGITPQDILCVQLAGLCHDLGHGPYSHLWEPFVNRVCPHRKWTHEECSVKMFDYLVKENKLQKEFEYYGLDEQDMTFIKELIAGPKPSDQDWPYEGRARSKEFLYEIVANKRTGVDVDKWDYFLRDGQSLRIRVTFEYERLIRFSRVLPGPNGEGNHICFRDKEIDNLYDMFHARRTLHRTAYQHRVVKIIDSMLSDAFCYADKHILTKAQNGSLLPLSEVCQDMKAFTFITDSIFHDILRSNSDEPEMESAKEIILNILQRHLYPFIGHTQTVREDITETTLVDTIIKHLRPESKVNRNDLNIQTINLNYGMGSKNPIEDVHFYSKSNPNIRTKLRSEDSRMLPQNFQEICFRLVCKRYDEESIKDTKVAFREACLELSTLPSDDSWPSQLTPVKNSGSVKGEKSPCDFSS